MLTELCRPSLQRNILMFVCESTYNRALMPEDIICLLGRRLLLLFQERPLPMLELIVTLLYTFKVVACVVLAIFIHPICHFIMFFSFQKAKQAGIWIFPCSSKMVASITPKRSSKTFGMPIGFTYVCPENVEPSNLFKGERLFQQLVYDAWTSIDQCNLI